MKDEDIKFSTENILDVKEYREKLIDDTFVFDDFVKRYGQTVDKVQEDIDSSSIQKRDDFIAAISKSPALKSMVSWIDHIRPWAIVQIQQETVDEQGKTKMTTLYGKIIEMWNDGKMVIAEKWSDEYNDTLTGSATQTYSEFLLHQDDATNVASNFDIDSQENNQGI